VSFELKQFGQDDWNIVMRPFKVDDSLPVIQKRITQDMIDAWADVSGDHNPLHTDPEYAKTTKFGGTIAHGHIALGFLCEMMIKACGESWWHGGMLQDVHFTAPVKPETTIETRGKVTSSETSDESVTYQCDISINETTSGTPCVLGQATFCLSSSN